MELEIKSIMMSKGNTPSYSGERGIAKKSFNYTINNFSTAEAGNFSLASIRIPVIK